MKRKLDKKGFTTLVASLFILKKDNPKDGKEVRNEKAEFKRIPEGGFFYADMENCDDRHP